MPFTPFHFGPGVVVKVIAPSYYSFSVFAFSQVLIDLETLFYILSGEWPIHRFFHSYLGATIVTIISFAVGRPLCGMCLAVFQHRLKITKHELLKGMKRINYVAALSGATIGSYSHVALDSVMHVDVRPFAPLSEGNVLLNTISVTELHLYCVIAGLIGAVGMGFWWLVWQEKR